jgi:type I restriction enzyme M protein
MPANHTEIEKRLWEAADELRANSKLKSSEYSVPVLGLIFLRYADQRFAEAEKKLTAAGSGRRKIGKTDYQAQGVLFIPEKARFANLLNIPEGADIGKAINEAMKSIEAENEDLKDVLPKTYNALEKGLLVSLLKNFSAIPITEGDAFGKIYEYFLGKFAMAEGQKGGEFFTPISIVKLIVEIIEPYHGRIFDPACGSGGMFVQSAAFVEHHKKNVNEISIYGQEKVAETIRICKMNLAVHGLSGDIRQSNTYYEDPHKSVSKFDFVMANPPFNVDKVDKERIKDDPRYPFGLPKADNANYLWIQTFYSTLNVTGRAGFVMANSAGDARGSELEIRKNLLQSRAVDVVVSIGPNFFYTVTLPCTLWFFDRGKAKTKRKERVLFIDARRIFQQIDRAHREFSSKQIEFISNIVRLYREEDVETEARSNDLLKQDFPEGKYADVLGLCRVSTLSEIEVQGWSLNPGRYVGVTERVADDFEFAERFSVRLRLTN